MDAPPEPSTDVFVSRFNRVLAVVIWAADAAFVVTFLLNTTVQQRYGYLALAPFVAFVAFVALWRPHLEVTDSQIVAENVFHSARVPWAALIDVDTKYALTLITPTGRVGVWAAPAPGRTSVLRPASKRDSIVPYLSGASRPGDRTSSESGQAAYLVRRRWNILKESGRIEVGIAESVKAQYSVRWVTIVLFVALAAVALTGTAIA